MSLRVLLVEDERELRATLREALTVEGYEVLSAASLADAHALTAQAERSGASVDLVLLDLGLPDGDGAAFLHVLRRTQATPLVVISAREADGEKVQLLDAGADDYLVKPFSLQELFARMRVALRHRGRNVEAAITLYRRADIDIDVAAHRVCRAGEAVHLTPTEFRLLARLVRQAGQVVTHRRLLADVWGPEHTEQTHYLRLYMGQLRAKLEDDAADPHLLLTEPGIGYRIADVDS